MAIVCPTVTPTEVHEYREQVERVMPFADRIHLDFMDGILAPTVSPPLEKIWLPEHKHIDLHIMYQRPADHLEILLKLKPSMVIVHPEADGVTPRFIEALKSGGIKFGLALMPAVQPQAIEPFVDQLDHVLIFSGDLGHFGGHANLELLRKVEALKALKKDLELGWDGGINDQNARLLQDGHIDVLNVGGFIQKAVDPALAYATLTTALKA